MPSTLRHRHLSILILIMGTTLLIAACGGSAQSTTTTTAAGGGSAAPATSVSTTTTTTTTVPAGGTAGGCPIGSYSLEDPGTGLPLQITSGGTGTVITIDSDDNVTISFDAFDTASGTTRGGSFTIGAQGVITGRIAETAAGSGEYQLTDVDASGITGQQTVTLDSGETFTISGAEFTQLAQGLAPYGPGAVITCSPSGDLVASAGAITQTYVRQPG
ncbi:MAG: hypothetical protein FJW94_10075 [Actinobacteria bacterium]|nr:hypothetical protein [Actinomycetota bacterium]